MNTPTPFWNLLEDDPGRLTHSPCQVCCGGVAGNHKVAIGNDGSRFKEVPGFIDLILTLNKTVLEAALIELLTAKTFLE